MNTTHHVPRSSAAERFASDMRAAIAQFNAAAEAMIEAARRYQEASESESTAVGGPDRIMKCEEAAAFVGVGYETMRQLTAQGDVPHTRIPSATKGASRSIIRYSAHALTEWMAKRARGIAS